ncbi:unnamed protein product, partial [Mesorhabditis belari]|uniref:Peptidase S1 domain-containing protein n=1 Tax=Mesorhabditis belari TaxID=2138241 RepID=A0AAF3FQI9_9BILA
MCFSEILGERNKRVIFGVPLARGELPYLTSLVSHFPHHRGDQGTLCGGSLIAPNIVLTAAHCVFNEQTRAKALSIRVIVNDFALGKADKFEQEFVTDSFDIHPLYLKSNFDPSFDLALIYLPTKIDVCKEWPSIKIARLPIDPITKNITDDQLKMAACFHSGWGVTNDGSNAPVAQRMRVVNIDFRANQHQLGGRTFEVKGAAGSRPCFGDSGGPVYCDLSNGRYVVGIASQIGTTDEKKPVNSNVQECSQASTLEVADLRSQTYEIVRMIKERGLYEELLASYQICFPNGAGQ